MIGNVKYINNLGGEVEFDISTQIIISSITGFTENYINLSMSQGFNQIGSTVRGTSVQAKDIIVNGEIIGETDDASKSLLNTILPDIDARLVYNNEWEITVCPTQTPEIEKYDYNAKFQFVLKAPYPYWSKIEESTAFLAGIEGQFSFPWDLSKSFTFGKRIESLFTNIYNSGNVETPYRITFAATANVINPKITNAATAEYFRIKKTMEIGEIITANITPRGITIVSNIDGVNTDAFGRLDINSNLYRLHPGDNVIAYDADSNRDGLDVVVYYSVTSVWVRGR